MEKINKVLSASVAPPSRSSSASPALQFAASPALPLSVGLESRCMVSAPSSPDGVVEREEVSLGSEASDSWM